MEENSKTQYTAKIKVKSEKDTVASGSISWDKKEGGFKCSLKNDSGDINISASGTLEINGKVTTLTLKKLTAEGTGDTEMDIKDLATTIVIDQDAKLPSTPKYTDLLTLDEDDFAELAEDIQEAAQEIAENFQ